MRLRVDASELRKAGVAARRLTRAMQADMLGAVTRTQLVVLEQARSGAPVFTGFLANSIQPDEPVIARRGDGITVSGVVQSTAPYAVVMEEGRRPGAAMPPHRPLRRWVELMVRRGKMAITGSIDSVTFLIRRAIARRGLPPRRFMARAAVAGEAHLQGEVSALAQRWQAEWEKR